MLRRTMLVLQSVSIAVFVAAALFGQQTQPAPNSASAREFPVIMSQKVVAGATAVGTKVEAKLAVATLMDGVVLPRDAVFSGQVIDSVAKSATDPSRLAIRMDSVTWKKGSAPVKLYLSAWYFPMKDAVGQNLSYGPPDTQGSPRNWNGAGTYPDPNSPISQPFPGRDSDAAMPSMQASPSSNISNRRAPIKDVQPARANDGSLVIVSARSTIKLDKLTTYVLTAGEPPPRN